MRHAGYEGEIVLVGDEHHLPYGCLPVPGTAAYRRGLGLPAMNRTAVHMHGLAGDVVPGV